MAFHGSSSCNQSPILFKGNNRALGINMIIHNDESGSMSDVNEFFSDGNFIESMQNALINENIGDDIIKYPNLFSYFGLYSRNYSSNFTVQNSNGSLLIQNTFIRGETSGSTTKSNWINNYYNNSGNFYVNVCNQNGRLTEFNPDSSSASPYTEDVHGNLWSIYTTPNSILSGTAGRYGGIISSPIRNGSKTIIISASDEQGSSPINMISVPVNVNSGTRIINGSLGETLFREYRVISLSSYNSSINYDGVLFYSQSSSEPYGYVIFTTPTTYTITRSSTPPTDWIPDTDQLHDMLTISRESLGALFKIREVFTNGVIDNRVAFSNCLAKFLSETL